MAPSKEAMEAARKLHDIMYGPEREWCRGTPCAFEEIVARSHVVYAAERIVEAERAAALAKLEAAQMCTTCDGQPHASGSICICGGSGRRSDETLNLRQLAQATQGQLDAAEERARVLGDVMAKIIRQCPECSEAPIICDNDEHDAIKAALDAKAAADKGASEGKTG